jgi:uncharacterized protein YdeI (YjbR/CyaY-like superfamily)
LNKQLPSDGVLYLTTRDEWRAWLQEHHASEHGIWLGYLKKEAPGPSIPYEDSVEEALCFGWVDSLIKKIDETSYARKFTPRKDGAVWSQSNKARAEKMIQQGRMTEVGLAKITIAQSRGEWQQEHTRPQFNTSDVPAELEEVLSGNPQARENFAKLTASERRQYILWVVSARLSETRTRRVREAVSLLEKNQKLGLR